MKQSPYSGTTNIMCQNVWSSGWPGTQGLCAPVTADGCWNVCKMFRFIQACIHEL
jgi:hypothetical protein